MLGVAAGWVLLASLVTLGGAVMTRWVILPRVAESGVGVAAHLTIGVARMAQFGAVSLVLGMVLFFARQLKEFRDPFAPLLEDAELLMRTGWGDVWAAGAAASIAVAILSLVALRRWRWSWWPITPLAAGLMAFPAFTGHAAGESDLRSVAILADVLHVAAAAGWMGSLAAVLYLELEWRRTSDDGHSLLPALVAAFSPVAIACVAVLVATGSFATWLHLEGIGQLFTTTYGRTLTVKLLLVVLVLGLGAVNWRRFSRQLGTSEGNDALRRAASLELLLGHVVLFMTAALIRTPPVSM